MAATTTCRIAHAIVKALDEPYCVRTTTDLSDVAGVACSTFRMWCRASDVHPRDVVYFAQALWAISMASRLGASPRDLLAFAEKRTLDRFEARSGTLGDGSSAVSLRDFCARQHLVEHRYIVAETRRLIAARSSGPGRSGTGA